MRLNIKHNNFGSYIRVFEKMLRTPMLKWSLTKNTGLFSALSFRKVMVTKVTFCSIYVVAHSSFLSQSMSSKHMMSLQSQLIIFTCFVVAGTAAKVPPMAKQNCSAKCGSVTIPYPFGIGSPNCYLNPYFEITCNKSSHKPFLRKFNLEVKYITIHDTYPFLEVYNPIYSTCRDGNSWKSSNLTGSPFRFSGENRLLASGCENILLRYQRNQVLAGSTSTRKGYATISEVCYGINCCETPIPFPFEFYTLSSTLNTSTCSYAFLLSSHSFSPNMSTFKFGDRAPVILSWGVSRSDFPGGEKRDKSYHCGHLGNLDNSGNFGLPQFQKCRCSYKYEGNPYIVNGCQVVEACAKCSGRCEKYYYGRKFFCIPNRTKEIIIVGTFGGAAAIVILIIFVFGVYKFLKRRRELKLKKNFFKRNGGLLLEQQISANDDSFDTTKIFTVKELEKATDNFNVSRVLGQGGQGTVYKGMLTDGKIVAVKKSKLVDESQVEQFINEVVILSQINHRNIVKLLGCCLETEVPLLVYEYISNGTLSQLIRNEDEFPLSWEMRLQIAIEVSGALAYLHSATSVPIYHRDIKSSNILLDDKYRAKVADFGTSRSVAIDQTHMTTIVQGTFGYLDPEFFRSSQFTDKSDVYSFGVVLAELLTGERPIMTRSGGEEKSLVTYFISALEGDFLFEIIDERVAEGSKDEVIALAFLAMRCLNMNGRQRPTMKQVMLEIERIRTSGGTKGSDSKKLYNVRSFTEGNKKQDDDAAQCLYLGMDDSHHLLSTGENKTI